jgi:imidazolonepropionase-like amidohydrolase
MIRSIHSHGRTRNHTETPNRNAGSNHRGSIPSLPRAFFFRVILCACVALSAASARAADTLVKNATVLTVTKGTYQNADLLIRKGKIAAIGRNLKVPAGVKVIDGTGKYVMPGIIDAHSHMCIEGGINEGSEVVSAECDIQEVINEKDPGMKWALAGGVTTINTMHGSANPIGGLTATLKMRWGKSSDELKFEGARRHIKWALGENPKRVHAERGVTTRLGVAETLRQQLTLAQEYQRDWDDYNRKKQAGLAAVPPRKDVKMESLAGILRGDIWVQCHCYRADEIEMVLRLADEFGFKIGALQHVLEGYKVAPEIAKRNFGASTFADFWGYKLEAYDGIAHNAAAMAQWGVNTSVNSDSGERIRRLNLDAAKAARYGGLTDDQCLALVTINPAWQLGIDKKTGSLEPGKDADISIWDGHPLSVYSKCMMTLVDGDVYYERSSDGKVTFGVTEPPKEQTLAKAAAPSAPSSTPSVAQSSSPSIAPSNFAPLSVPVTAKPSGPASFAITGARIVPVSSPPIEDGTIVVFNGRITAVGRDVPIPSGIRVWRANGLSVYPGLINATGNLGLSEISSVPESQDLGEGGPLKAHIRAEDAFHVQSAWVGVARSGGVTSALVSPRGTGWMGQSALMHTGGRTVEDCTVAGGIAQALSLGGGGGGRSASGGEGGITPPGGDPQQGTTGEGLRSQVEKALLDARSYGKELDAYKRGADPSVRPPKPNLTLGALVPVSRQERSVLIAASDTSDVEQAAKFGLANRAQVIVTGGRDADKAAATLNKAGVPVIFTDLLSMPTGTDAYDKNFTAPKRLFEAGVKFCIATTDAPNLGVHAGMAAAHGLPRDEALKAVTLYPAQLLGVEKDLGSIEVGKIADLLITDGDPLEVRTKIRKMFINGVDMPLVSKHTQLYEEYKRKGR